MGLANVQQRPIQGHIERTGLHVIGKYFPTEAN